MNRDEPAWNVAREIADEWTARGASAVVLFGSVARGDAHPESDIDLVALGEGPDYRLFRRDGFLIAETWWTRERCLESFADPGAVGAAIPGWRTAAILRDETGVAAAIRERAFAWRWDDLDDAPDRWVADGLTGLAEEVHKLRVALERGASWTAAVQRNLLALQCAGKMAVHRRLLYGTENVLWNRVADALGEQWRDAQSRAFAERGEPFAESCRAALELYALACEEARTLFDERQREVVEHARHRAKMSLRTSNENGDG